VLLAAYAAATWWPRNGAPPSNDAAVGMGGAAAEHIRSSNAPTTVWSMPAVAGSTAASSMRCSKDDASPAAQYCCRNPWYLPSSEASAALDVRRDGGAVSGKPSSTALDEKESVSNATDARCVLVPGGLLMFVRALF
jgi:hypothetical protein